MGHRHGEHCLSGGLLLRTDPLQAAMLFEHAFAVF
jgi:hypothetical protein